VSVLKQLSVLTENRIGKLADITGTVGDAGADILGFSIAEGENFGIIRLMVDRPEEAYEALRSKGHTVSYTEVLAIRMEDRPGGLHEAASACGRLGVNIVYAYAFRNGEGAVLVMKVGDTAAALRSLRGAGIEPLAHSSLK